jgi:hypothetical protein
MGSTVWRACGRHMTAKTLGTVSSAKHSCGDLLNTFGSRFKLQSAPARQSLVQVQCSVHVVVQLAPAIGPGAVASGPPPAAACSTLYWHGRHYKGGTCGQMGSTVWRACGRHMTAKTLGTVSSAKRSCGEQFSQASSSRIMACRPSCATDDGHM